MKVGDLVTKPKGYSFEGEVRSVFTNKKGDTRIVAEHLDSQTEESSGMLHIFSPKQLEIKK